MLVALLAVTAAACSSSGRTAHPVGTTVTEPARTATSLPTSLPQGEAVPARSTIRFADVEHGWASGAGGILATADGGATWQLEYPSAAGVGPISFLDRRTGWAVEGTTLIATTDGGSSWRRVGAAGALPGPSDLAFVDADRGWAVVHTRQCSQGSCEDVGSLLRTLDGGASWSPVGEPGATQAMCWDGQRGWAGAGTALRTTVDGGERWSPVPTPIAETGEIADIACAGGAVWVKALHGAAAGSEGYEVLRSVDARHWDVVLGGLVHQGLPSIDAYSGPLSARSALSALFVGYCPACGNQPAASATRTDDGGRSFQRSPVTSPTDPGFLPAAVSFADHDHGWILGTVTTSAGHGGGAVYATVDGGRTWRIVVTSAALAAPAVPR